MTFGESAENYHKARNGYPKEVFDLILNKVNSTDNSLLDLGCGTGVATVELRDKGFTNITACDYDQSMIDEALLHDAKGIEYCASPANNLPFCNDQFDVVTIFGAFHWFCDDDSVNEIKRVLKDDGIIFIINKNDTSEFRNDVINIARQFIELNQENQKENYIPEKILANHDFKNISEYECHAVEKYDLNRLLSIIKSMKFWSHIPKEMKSSLVEEYESHFSIKITRQYYDRAISVNVISGYK